MHAGPLPWDRKTNWTEIWTEPVVHHRDPNLKSNGALDKLVKRYNKNLCAMHAALVADLTDILALQFLVTHFRPDPENYREKALSEAAICALISSTTAQDLVLPYDSGSIPSLKDYNELVRVTGYEGDNGDNIVAPRGIETVAARGGEIDVVAARAAETLAM